jgi:hypothetical protein
MELYAMKEDVQIHGKLQKVNVKIVESIFNQNQKNKILVLKNVIENFGIYKE